MLSFERVSKSYRRGRRQVRVLEEVSFEVADGDHVAIRGRRRAGKSTLLLLCAGMEAPDEGVVRFDGKDLATAGHKERARLLRDEIGFVSSAFEQERGTSATRPNRAVDSVAIPLVADGWSPQEAEGPAREALQRVGALGCLDAGMNELSPGEHTLVALARALVREPRLILVDEPESCPSPEERETIRLALQDLGTRADVAVLVASESIGAMRRARQLFALDGHGRLLAEARPGVVVPFEKGTSASSGSA